jgi:hypothetical protein
MNFVHNFLAKCNNVPQAATLNGCTPQPDTAQTVFAYLGEPGFKKHFQGKFIAHLLLDSTIFSRKTYLFDFKTCSPSNSFLWHVFILTMTHKVLDHPSLFATVVVQSNFILLGGSSSEIFRGVFRAWGCRSVKKNYSRLYCHQDPTQY